MSRVLPILFQTELVRAILAGRKTATRRVIKYQPNDVYDAACTSGKWSETYEPSNPPEEIVEWFVKNHKKPPYMPGDVLYVRETWAEPETVYGVPYYAYKADDNILHHSSGGNFPGWRPSIHMPKSAARIWLQVTEVRVERLQDITEEQAEAEGVVPCYEVIRPDEEQPVIYQAEDGAGYCQIGFQSLWNSVVRKSGHFCYAWAANPWVYVIEFIRCEKPENIENNRR